MGFDKSTGEITREKAMKALNDFLRPEFINRVDEIVCFNKLSEENFTNIARLMLEELRDAMAERGLALTWDDSVLDYLVKKSYSVTYGARNLRRTIQKDVEDRIAAAVIDGYDANLTAVSVTAPDGAVRVDVL
jgi:ATP-dependent Clp protease ATP-binding subunit ClpB